MFAIDMFPLSRSITYLELLVYTGNKKMKENLNKDRDVIKEKLSKIHNYPLDSGPPNKTV